MIRVIKPDPPPKRYVDLDEPLAGRCMTCGSLVHCAMRDAQLPSKQFVERKEQLGAWVDLVSAECPQCKARVFVMPAGDFQNLAVEKRRQNC